jgi:hypothetical protein
MEGKKFVDRCLNSPVLLSPWPHQIIEDTISPSIFAKLKLQCEKNLNFKTTELIHIHPDKFKDYGIEFYDETFDICKQLLAKIKYIQNIYPSYREYKTLGINAHISITPPLPYKFYVHQEGLEKTWSSVTYITPDENIGTKMYKKQSDTSFVKEAKWKPNSTFIFCGQQGKTWHSYESNQQSNRITLNLFVMKYREKKCFYSE